MAGGQRGPLDGIRIVELAHEYGAWAGKLLADLGAEVIVVEPPGGAQQRTYGPFLGDIAGPERSLWWWHYNTSKRSVVLDLDDDGDRARLTQLLESADVFLECERPGRLRSLGLDWPDLETRNPRLVMLSLTAYGRTTPDALLPATDLTLLADGGPVWSCGYDDHTIPPVRGGGNQAYHTAGHWAVMALLVALLEREDSGQGQHIDASINATANVTTEIATYAYLAVGAEVQRFTGRHATPVPSMPTQALCGDGRYLNTGVPPRNPKEFRQLLAWIDELGLRDEVPLISLIEMGAERETLSLADVATEPIVAEMFGAARECRTMLAHRLSAYDFFIGSQRYGMAVGIVYSPEEAMADPHFIERGFPVEVEHAELGRSFTYPGAPYKFEKTPWRIGSRAPLLGEHNDMLTGSASPGTSDVGVVDDEV